MSDVEESSLAEVPAAERRESVLLIIGAVMVVVFVGVAVVSFALSRHDDDAGRMVGPSRAFPSPIVVPAQPHAVRRAATAPAGVLVYGGLYLAGLGTREVRAVDIRSGRPYWRYDRKGVAAGWVLDRTVGRLVIVWSDGDSERVEAIDVRAGRVVWRQRSIPKLTKYPLAIPVELLPDPVTKVIGAVGEQWVVGLDAGTGRVRWKRRLSADCSPFHQRTHYAQVMPGVFAVEEVCNARKGDEVNEGDVVGYDARTGADRWKVGVAEASRGMPGLPNGTSRFGVLDGLFDLDGRLLALRLLGDAVALIDPMSGHVVARRYTAWSELTYGAGMQVGLCTAGGEQVLCADDPKREKRLWRRPMPRGLEPHAPTVIDQGRVYLLAARHDNSDWQLIITELRTGKPLANISLPEPAGYRPPPNPPVSPGDVPSWADNVVRAVTDGILVTGAPEKEYESRTVDLLIQQ